MIDKALVAAFSLVLVLSFFVGMLGMVLAVSQKITFDSICRNTLLQIDIDGGLTDSSRRDLVSRLDDSGFAEINVSGPSEVQYGGWIHFIVSARAKSVRWICLLTFSGEGTEFAYDRQIVSRKIHNAAY